MAQFRGYQGRACSGHAKKGGVSFIQKAAARVDLVNDQVELMDGSLISYDCLIIATGPRLAFDEVEGLWPADSLTGSRPFEGFPHGSRLMPGDCAILSLESARNPNQ